MPIACGHHAPYVFDRCRFSELHAAVAGYEKWTLGRDINVTDPVEAAVAPICWSIGELLLPTLKFVSLRFTVCGSPKSLLPYSRADGICTLWKPPALTLSPGYAVLVDIFQTPCEARYLHWEQAS